MEPLSFRQLKAQLFRTLAQLKIDDSEFRSQMAPWGEEMGSPGQGGISPPLRAGSSKVFHGLCVGIEINGNPRGWFYQLHFTVISPGILQSISPATQPATAPRRALHQLRLKLPDPVSDVDVAGAQILRRGMSEVDFWEPQQLTFDMPDKQSFSIATRSVNVMFFDGVARGVFIRRPLQPVSYREAKSDMLSTLHDIHIEPDDSLEFFMSSWPTDLPNTGNTNAPQRYFQAGMRRPVHGVEVNIRLIPDGSGWDYLIILDDPYMAPVASTQPSAPAALPPK